MDRDSHKRPPAQAGGLPDLSRADLVVTRLVGEFYPAEGLQQGGVVHANSALVALTQAVPAAYRVVGGPAERQ